MAYHVGGKICLLLNISRPAGLKDGCFTVEYGQIPAAECSQNKHLVLFWASEWTLLEHLEISEVMRVVLTCNYLSEISLYMILLFRDCKHFKKLISSKWPAISLLDVQQIYMT